MKSIYLVEVGDDVFNYSHITDKASLSELRRHLKGLDFPPLISHDITRLEEIGGTIVTRKLNKVTYLVDINYRFDKRIRMGITYQTVLSVIKKIRLDLKLDEILN